jgi:hypothetical protein
MLDSVSFIAEHQAREVVMKYHYSKVMPRITKTCVGGYKDGMLVAVCTLGYGVRPLHTLKKAFPSLEVKDYLEIGKLCVADEMPRNTESYFLARVISLVKKSLPEVKLLYSWADGIIGKPGYVYQSSNFFYGGYIWTEMYLSPDGVRVHPRTLQGISDGERVGKFKSRAYGVTAAMGYKKYFGLQFRYVYPLCDKHTWKDISSYSPFSWSRSDYPKDKDCLWQEQIAKGVRAPCGKPPFATTQYVKEKNAGQLPLFTPCSIERKIQND